MMDSLLPRSVGTTGPLERSYESDFDTRGVHRSQRAAGLLFAGAIALGALVLSGWLLAPGLVGHRWLTNAKPSTALCMVLLGSALRVQLRTPYVPGRTPVVPLHAPIRRNLWVGFLVLVVELIAGSSLYDAAFGGSSSLDVRVARAIVRQAGLAASPMSPVSALNLSLLGLSCLWLRAPQRGRASLALGLVVLPLFFSLVALVGYAYGVQPFHRVAGVAPMVALSAAGVLLLALGVTFARLSPEAASLVAGHGRSSAAARRLLLGLFSIPIGLGWVERAMYRQHLYEPEFGAAMLTVASILLLCSLTLLHLREQLRAQRERRTLELDLAHKEGQLQADSEMRALADSLASARQRAQQAMQRSEERFRALAVHAPVGIFESDAKGDCTFINRRWSEITGLSFEEAVGKGWTRVIHPEDSERVNRAWFEAATLGVSFAIDYRYLTNEGEVAWVHGASVPLRDEHGVTTGYMGTIVDVTERRRTLDALARSEANFRLLVENAPFGVIVMRAGIIVYANKAYCQILGYDDMSELTGRSALDALVHPDDHAWLAERMRARQAGPVAPVTIVRCLRKDGSTVQLESASASLTFDGEPSLMAVVRDVTERERVEQVRLLAERTLRDSLHEKEVLLKEIHHRVKNNLQVIVSLINLQSQKLDDPTLHSVFDELRGRVHAIALLHERLYGSKNLGRIDMSDYLSGLASDLSSTNVDPRPIALQVQVSALYLEVDAAVPIGLIVNELVTNSFKHAFPRELRNGGNIVVALTREADALVLCVSDDGVGYPAGLDPDTVGSLGLLLISSLSSQLEGRVELSATEHGSRSTVRFPARD
jgi:PAS domain S-box-containing protein